MQTHQATTPFGRRTLTLAQIASQAIVKARPTAQSIHKWEVYQALCTARARLGIPERALAVLNALLTFHPETTLTGEAVIVFPSNEQLSRRAHGMPASTLRRHLAVLVEAGLIIRRDSPNGKRYARRSRGGGIEFAYGFDLAPLITRADEFSRLARETEDAARALKLARERITICRRDISKMIAMAQQELCEPAAEHGGQIWLDLHARYCDIADTLSRTATLDQLELIAGQLSMLAEEILSRLELQTKIEKVSTIESSNERHIQNSDPESLSDSEPVPAIPATVDPAATDHHSKQKKAIYPLDLVLQACPDIVDYTRGGIGNWRDFLAAASMARSILRISPSAWEEAQTVMGEAQAAVAVACITQRAATIRSAGGYLRGLTRKAEGGHFSLGPVLMAQIKAQSQKKAETSQCTRL